MRGKTTARAYLLSRNQARKRQQQWLLTEPEYDAMWQGKEDQRGRSANSLSLCRIDLGQPWQRDNCVLMTRTQYRHKVKQRNAQLKKQEEK
jgi:hypothetical protein